MGTTLSRQLFPQDISYFKTGTIGLSPLRTGGEQAYDWGSQRWYEQWAQGTERVRELFAQLIGAKTHEILLAPSVPTALSCITAALQSKARSALLMCDLDVPTLGLPWMTQKKVLILPSADRIHLPFRAFARTLDTNTLLVAVSRVQPTSGAITDVQTLAHLAHQHGSLLLVDDSYAAGYLPLDVNVVGIDILVADSRRWLMGSPGLTFLYVRERVLPQLTPLFSGAFGLHQAASNHLDLTRINDQGPPPQTLIDAHAGLDLIQSLGIHRIWKHIHEQTTYLLDQFLALEWDALRTGGQQGALILLRTEYTDRLMKELEADHLLVGTQPGFLEIAPALFTSQEDSERMIHRLEKNSNLLRHHHGAVALEAPGE